MFEQIVICLNKLQYVCLNKLQFVQTNYNLFEQIVICLFEQITICLFEQIVTNNFFSCLAAGAPYIGAAVPGQLPGELVSVKVVRAIAVFSDIVLLFV